jgi:hypothetical protein
MSTRMQQRRGTSSQWTTGNPVLSAGEIGFETNTGKFKIGNGTSAWSALDYFASSAEITAILDGAPDALNTLNELAAAINDDPNFFTTVSNSIFNHENDTTGVHGISDTAQLATKTYVNNGLADHAGSTTSVHGISNTANLVYTQDLHAIIVNETTNLAPKADPTFTGTVVLPSTTSIGDISATEISYLDGVTTLIQPQIAAKAPKNDPTFTGTVVLPSTTSIGNVSATEIGYVDGVTSAIQTQIDAKAPIANPTFTGTVAGITKSMVGLGNVDNTTDANKPVSTATQTALDAKLALVGGTMTGALTLSGAPTVDLHAATKAYVDNVTSGLNFHQPVRVATTANITLSGTQTIDGVSVIAGDRVLVKDQTTQTQNGLYVVAAGAWSRAADADNTPDGELKGGDFTLVLEGTVGSGYGYVCSNTSAITIGTTNVTYVAFNAAKAISAGTGLTESTPGTIDIATGGVTSAMIADGTIVDADINATAAIAQSKISGLSASLSAKADLASPTFTGTVSGITKSMVGLGSVDNTADTAKPVSTAQQTALDLKANLASPTFTGTVAGITASMVGLGNVNNTTDLSKPISTSTQTALDTKAPTASPTFTGTVTVSASGVAFTDGTQTKEGVPSRTPIIAKTASYTLSALTERDSLVEVNSGSATTITIPTNATIAYPVGTSIDILQVGAGQVTIAGASGVTVNATPGLKLRTQWSGATLFKRATDTWVVYGDLSA